jgi:NAD(P)H-hydrate epimerase
MLGAAHLSSRAAQRAGAGMVRLSSPGVEGDEAVPTEVVGRALPADGWAQELLADLDRFDAVVVGPGLGRSEAAVTGVRSFVARATVPTLVDGDGLFAFQGDLARFRRRPGPTVLTPHDGEYQLLTGTAPGPDRLEAARHLASKSGAVVLLKGPATIVADPDGRALISTAGDARLATAGTGDVLSGTIGALLAQGVAPFEAAALGAWLHGAAAELGPSVGLVAGDLPDLLPAVLSSL